MTPLKFLVLIAMVFTYLLGFLFGINSWAEVDIQEVLSIISKAESNDRDFIIGDNGNAFGRYQVSKELLKDYDRATYVDYAYKPEFLLQKEFSNQVAIWHITENIIPLLIKHSCLDTAHICRAWNRGLKGLKNDNFVIPKSDKNDTYDREYKKYWRLK